MLASRPTASARSPGSRPADPRSAAHRRGRANCRSRPGRSVRRCRWWPRRPPADRGPTLGALARPRARATAAPTRAARRAALERQDRGTQAIPRPCRSGLVRRRRHPSRHAVAKITITTKEVANIVTSVGRRSRWAPGATVKNRPRSSRSASWRFTTDHGSPSTTEHRRPRYLSPTTVVAMTDFPPPPIVTTGAAPVAANGGPVGKPRSIGLVILLSIVTFGVWTIIWSYQNGEELKSYARTGPRRRRLPVHHPADLTGHHVPDGGRGRAAVSA